jgi:hypothetical protein
MRRDGSPSAAIFTLGGQKTRQAWRTSRQTLDAANLIEINVVPASIRSPYTFPVVVNGNTINVTATVR